MCACSLVILYSFSQPHIIILVRLFNSARFTRILLPLLIVSCSRYSSYPVRLTRGIPFALLRWAWSQLVFMFWLIFWWYSVSFVEGILSVPDLVCRLEHFPLRLLSFCLVHIRLQSFNLVCIVCLLLVCSLFAVVLLLSSFSRASLAFVFALSFLRCHFRGRDIYCWFFFASCFLNYIYCPFHPRYRLKSII